MANIDTITQKISRPGRWDVPFSRDTSGGNDSHDMPGEDLRWLLSLEPFRTMARPKSSVESRQEETFPDHTPLAEILQNDTRIRRCKHRDVVVRRGDYGSSAFLLLRGRVRVIVDGVDPVNLGRRERPRKSWLRSAFQMITNSRSTESRDTRLYSGVNPASTKQARRRKKEDAASTASDEVDLLTIGKGRMMSSGEMFGELAALGRIPRTATVVAVGDRPQEEILLLELRWQGLRDLRKYDSTLRHRTDEQYRKFGLADMLMGSPLLSQLGQTQIASITQAAIFETYGTFDWHGTYKATRERGLQVEPIIAEEGHYTNGMILIRAGFARLSRRYGHGERTSRYLGKGDVYGLAELAHNADKGTDLPQQATLRAIGYVDVVRIPTRIIEESILPYLPASSIPSLLGRAPQTGSATTGTEPREIESSTMEFLVDNRFINGTATMLIDLERCTRCDDCVRACAIGHDNNPRFIRHGPIVGRWMVANACMHCVDPVCMIGCPTGAIHRDEDTGEVVINDVTCIGCQTCAQSCPYDNIRMVEIRDRAGRNEPIVIDETLGQPILKATKCDLCVDHHGGPACVRACPHDALIRTDMWDPDSLAEWVNR